MCVEKKLAHRAEKHHDTEQLPLLYLVSFAILGVEQWNKLPKQIKVKFCPVSSTVSTRAFMTWQHY